MTSVPIPITLKSRRKASLVQGESSVLIYERHNSGGLREKERASHHGKGKKKNLIKEGKKEGMNLNELCPIIVLKEERGFTWSVSAIVLIYHDVLTGCNFSKAEALNSEFVREVSFNLSLSIDLIVC